MKHLLIIGNGIAGITVARHARQRSDHRITVVSSEATHFFSRPALMYIFMGHMKYEHTKPYEDWFWTKNRIDLLAGHVDTIDINSKRVHLRDGRDLSYDQLVLATGSTTQTYGWPGQDLAGVAGLVSLQDLDTIERHTRRVNRAVIVGGGLIGVELAEMLLSRQIPVTWLVREEYYWDNVLPKEEARMISRHILEHRVDLRLGTQLKEIHPGPDGHAAFITTDKGERISCGFVGLTTGVRPQIDLVRGSGIEFNRGILVNEFLETNVPDVFAAGDCAEFRNPKPRHPKIEQLWYTGRLQAEALARTICGERTAYDRGLWFNSAKFFDIEYQTYGMVANTPLPDEASFYWEHDNHHQCVRFVYRRDNGAMVGLHTFGIRMRQSVCHEWIREQRSIDYVMDHLDEANFDPEFFRAYQSAIVASYVAVNGKRRSTGKDSQRLYKSA